MINEIMDDEKFESNFKEWKEWNSEETDLDTLHCTYVWEYICNPN